MFCTCFWFGLVFGNDWCLDLMILLELVFGVLILLCVLGVLFVCVFALLAFVFDLCFAF